MTAEEKLQRRQVRALERIADALERITGDIDTENHVSTPEARLHALPDPDPDSVTRQILDDAQVLKDLNGGRPEPMGSDDM